MKPTRQRRDEQCLVAFWTGSGSSGGGGGGERE